MHVHIDALGIDGDEQAGGRMSVAAEHIHIGRAQGAEQQLVSHGAPIDIDELGHRRAP